MNNLQTTLLQIGEYVEEHGKEIDSYQRRLKYLPQNKVIESVKLIKCDGALWTIKKINGQIYDVSCSDLFTIY